MTAIWGEFFFVNEIFNHVRFDFVNNLDDKLLGICIINQKGYLRKLYGNVGLTFAVLMDMFESNFFYK
jgi:hypothetical protein